MSDNWGDLERYRKPPLTPEQAREELAEKLAFAESHQSVGIMVATEALRWAQDRIAVLEADNERLQQVALMAARCYTFTYGGYRWVATHESRDNLYDALRAVGYGAGRHAEARPETRQDAPGAAETPEGTPDAPDA